ncbi:MAG: cadherin repeat domain-containing protein, partial [Planctomycetaceae bacterium]|nr:cadherin repeat domain-containing protein [Planctomycetaceae bacterium]
MPRNWLRNLSDRLSAKSSRRQVRRSRKPGGANIQPLENRVLLVAPTLVGATTFNLSENVGVNTVVLNPFTNTAFSNNYTDPITGATYVNPSNGHFVGALNATPNDGGQVILDINEPPGTVITAATPFNVIFNNVTRQGEIYINNFEAIDFEENPTFTITVRITDSGTAGVPETNDVTFTVNLINGKNDIPYI